MTDTERVNQLKVKVLALCEEIASLLSDGIRIEWNIQDGKLIVFRAWKEMKDQ